MDKYYLALLGEAGATGLAKAFYMRFKLKELEKAYHQELSHWTYFKKFRSSKLEKPIYYALIVFGLLVSIFGLKVTKAVIRRLEAGAINFYLERFSGDKDVEWIIENEREHMEI
ncbi:hypothetical protein [Sulfolobus acidocaldarius]|uniref:Conserved protein n=4 Tax=Sulfolobus acidocaldarius TaxID=2285 RepID=Q4J7J5_SULAC|nr:hypothetical protein [Sulfolobus acidocaldarius]AAY81236.1 conserved protein [Sulfolobus acidocaldarius DSM 639]AGE71863.1 hypothetical protein SacN8_09530 [Sulfolobus acidocaldarius N8]AGE74135.1 hypothetical protein SacRon12I_09550 [Sulfolobus acidocaldarius Ron12/I]ALU29956.1 hypothetical protein ATY89_08415 [Sulfolobus acidocaldarius]ALU32699.1 hypothetical protein ATZ20_11430 [Sulfolobus acidocaldarius]